MKDLFTEITESEATSVSGGASTSFGQFGSLFSSASRAIDTGSLTAGALASSPTVQATVASLAGGLIAR